MANVPLTKPSRKPARQRANDVEIGGTARVVISASTHAALRQHCFEHRCQMKEVLDLLVAGAKALPVPERTDR